MAHKELISNAIKCFESLPQKHKRKHLITKRICEWIIAEYGEGRVCGMCGQKLEAIEFVSIENPMGLTYRAGCKHWGRWKKIESELGYIHYTTGYTEDVRRLAVKKILESKTQAEGERVWKDIQKGRYDYDFVYYKFAKEVDSACFLIELHSIVENEVREKEEN